MLRLSRRISDILKEYSLLKHIQICMKHTTITLPDGLHGKAKEAGLNVSRIAENAIVRTLKVIEENETGSDPSQSVPATTPIEGGQ